jgi:hypothetical protein
VNGCEPAHRDTALLESVLIRPFQKQGLRSDLAAGRAALWEDVARRVGVLLSAPAAFAGEHFVQVRIQGVRVGGHAAALMSGLNCRAAGKKTANLLLLLRLPVRLSANVT